MVTTIYVYDIYMDEDPTLPSLDPDPAWLKKTPDPTLNRSEEKNVGRYKPSF